MVIGREYDSKEVISLLETNKKPVLIHGLRGLGKTTLCRLIYTRLEKNPRFMYLAVVEVLEDFLESFVNELYIHCPLERGVNESNSEKFSKILRELSNAKGDRNQKLLVIDNAVWKTEESRKCLEALLDLDWTILLTSYREVNKTIVHELMKLSKQDAKYLFQRNCTKQGTDSEIEELIQLLDYHTLSIDIYSKTLEKNSFLKTVQDLLQKIKDHQWNDKYLTKYKVISEHSKNEEISTYSYLQRIFDISDWMEDAICVYVFQNLCVYPAKEFEREAMAIMLKTETMDEMDLDEKFLTLMQNGWLERWSDSECRMHGVIKEIVYARLEPKYEDVAMLVKGITEKLEDSASSPKATYQWEEPAKELSRCITTVCPEMAIFELWLGRLYHHNGYNEDAIFYYIKALDTKIQIHGEKHEEVAALYNNLGLVYKSKGNYDKAIEYHEKAQEIILKVLDNNHPHIASVYNNLGAAYKYKGDYDKAIEYHEKAQEINLKVLDNNHSHIATTYNNLGEAYRFKGIYDKAIEYYEKAQEINLKVLDNNHPHIATTYNNLGEAYRFKGIYDNAIEYHEKALKIRLEKLGSVHPDIAQSYNNFGIAYYYKGNYDKAIEYYEKSLKIHLEKLGSDHIDVAITYNNLGWTYKSKEDYDKAIEYHEKALKIKLVVLGSDHIDVANTYNNLGSIYYSKKDYEKAIEYSKKALKIRLEKLGKDHPDVATTYNNLGGVYFNQKMYKDSMLMFEKAIGILRKFVPDSHPNMRTMIKNYKHVKGLAR